MNRTLSVGRTGRSRVGVRTGPPHSNKLPARSWWPCAACGFTGGVLTGGVLTGGTRTPVSSGWRRHELSKSSAGSEGEKGYLYFIPTFQKFVPVEKNLSKMYLFSSSVRLSKCNRFLLLWLFLPVVTHLVLNSVLLLLFGAGDIFISGAVLLLAYGRLGMLFVLCCFFQNLG